MSTLAVIIQLPAALTVVEATGAARTCSSTTLAGAPMPPTTKAPSSSLTRTLLICGGTGVAVAVGAGVGVSVIVAVGAGVGVSVAVLVGTTVDVSVAVGTGVDVSVAVLVAGTVAVAVGRGTGVSVLVDVGSGVAVSVGMGVGVGRSTTTRSRGIDRACVSAPWAPTIWTPILAARVSGSAASIDHLPDSSTVAVLTEVSSSTT